MGGNYPRVWIPEIFRDIFTSQEKRAAINISARKI
jgi:hypothetical protein